MYLVEFLSKLLLSNKFADVFFVVGEDEEKETFPAHRLLLAASSPLFEAMLYPPSFIENPPPVQLPMTINISDPDITPQSFKALLTVIYTDECQVNADNISELIACAKKYQIEKLQISCAEFMEGDVNADNVLELYEMAPALLGDNEFGLDFIRENAEEIFASEGFESLSESRVATLLKDDDLSIEEQSVFAAVQRWGRAQIERDGGDVKSVEALSKVISNLLPLIRFPSMDVAAIATSVAPSGLLSQLQLLDLFKYASLTDSKARILMEMPFLTNPRQSSFSITGETKLLESKYKKDIIKMFSLSQNKSLKFTLLYRGSRDGFVAKNFHNKCDGKGPTFTIARSKKGNVFGGYYAGSWAGSGYKSEASWIYSLKNSTGKVLKYKPQNTTNNAYCNKNSGPTWGGGHDLSFTFPSKQCKGSANPNVYKTADSKFPTKGVTLSSSTLAGSSNFEIEEIEVFSAVQKK